MDNKKIIDEIRKYYMNPKSYPNENKIDIENAIKLMNSCLKGDDDSGTDLISTLCSVYSSDESTTPINSLMHQSRADEDGIASTRGYKEIYFNEIVQNANDNTNSNYLNIYANREKKDQGSIVYSLVFEYKDSGFSVENIIGLFNSEIHTKKDNLSATGKHGVGIKALFYFVDTLKIESNIIAEFNISTINEDGVEKIYSAVSSLEINKKWDKETTHLTIEYRHKDNYGSFNVGKLNNLIDILCNEGNQIISTESIKSFFFDDNQEKLVFDCRALLFMDKNKGKKNGITQLAFFHNDKQRLSISVNKKETDKINNNNSDYIIGQCSIKYNDDDVVSYLVVTMESEGDQNFSIAFPNTDKITKNTDNKNAARYYETYYIPEGANISQNICIPFNVLINSKYSSVDRRKLTDDSKNEEKIVQYFNSKIVSVFKYLTSSQLQEKIDKGLKLEISKLFHKCLVLDDDFISLCYVYRIDNHYLLKYKEDCTCNQFIIYQREAKEAYEKKLLGQSVEISQVIDFFNNNIICDEAIKYDENLFLDIIKDAYKKAYTDSTVQLRAVLNAVGGLKELIKYRVSGSQYKDDIDERQLDSWISTFQPEQQKIALSLIGRYKIHPKVSANGEILGSSFYEYLFSDNNSSCGAFAEKQQQEFSEKYACLKNRLHELLINKDKSGKAVLWNSTQYDYNKGEVAFFASWDNRAGYDVYYDTNNWTEYDYQNGSSNTQKFGNELFNLLLERLSTESNICDHIKCFNNKMMITSSDFPKWGVPTPYYNHKYILQTAHWFTAKVINLNFMSDIRTDKLDQFKEYIKYFVENKEKWSNFQFKISANINYSDDMLIVLMNTFYKYGLLNGECSIFSQISVTININNKDSIPNDSNANLCPKDYAEFINKMTGLKIIVAQVANINSAGKELVFLNNDCVKIYNKDNWEKICDVKDNNEKQQVIAFINERLDWNEALSLILTEICKNKDVVEKCKAFIPQNQGIAVWGEKFTEIHDSEYNGKPRFRNVILTDYASNMSADQLKYIITARGNNNNSCGCCGQLLKKHNLVIVANKSDETKKDYPYIINVVCDECYTLLKNSHKESVVIEDSIKGIIIEHKCLLQNSHQQKEIVKRYIMCNGIASILNQNKK